MVLHVYLELPPWDGEQVKTAKKMYDLPLEVKQYIAFLAEALRVVLPIITTGPKREQAIRCF